MAPLVRYTILTGKLLLLLPLSFFAQTKTLPFQLISAGSGQDINFIYNITQDQQGFLWFGTLNGLVRYDGYNCRNYNNVDGSGLKGRKVNGVKEDRYGHLWVVSDYWLQAYDPVSDSFYDMDNLDGDTVFQYSNTKINRMMPEMDGFELCDKLKMDFRTSHIPIILLTAKADMPSRIEGLERGADAYLAKPFHKEELQVRLHKLLEIRKQLQERYASLPSAGSRPPSVEYEIEDAFMKQVRDILEAHLSDEYFGILDLCKELGMSRPQFYRKFKALSGQTVGQYFRSLRLNKAKALLLATSLHISEIAYEVGFKDPAYFTRVFKEEFGVNPSEVRK